MADLIAWVIVQDEAGRILLGRRGATRLASGLWNLPGGAVEPREVLSVAAARELREETGLQVAPGQLHHIGVYRYDVAGQHGRVQGVNFFFLARTWKGQARPLEHTSEIGWFKPETIPLDSLPWLGQALRTHLLEGRFFAEQVD